MAMESVGSPALPRLGKYELVKEQAGSGVAASWLAREVEAADKTQLVALLRVHRHLVKKLEEGALLRDVERAKGLSHDACVQVLDAAILEGDAYVVQDYAEGETLAALTQAAGAEGLPLGVALRIGLDVLDGLAALHAFDEGLCHGELAPHNIRVAVNGATRIAGIATARALAKLGPHGAKNHDRLAYAAPERVKAMAAGTAGAPDVRSDLFSLGVILWELCAKTRLFSSKIEAAVIQKVLTAPVASLTTFGISAPIDDVVHKLLERDPARRFASARDAFESLEGVVTDQVGTRAAVAEALEKACGKAIATRRTEIEAAREGRATPSMIPKAPAPRKGTLLGFAAPTVVARESNAPPAKIEEEPTVLAPPKVGSKPPEPLRTSMVDTGWSAPPPPLLPVDLSPTDGPESEPIKPTPVRSIGESEPTILDMKPPPKEEPKSAPKAFKDDPKSEPKAFKDDPKSEPRSEPKSDPKASVESASGTRPSKNLLEPRTGSVPPPPMNRPPGRPPPPKRPATLLGMQAVTPPPGMFTAGPTTPATSEVAEGKKRQSRRPIAPVSNDDLHVGSRLGDYELLQDVARGGMATVWAAIDTRDGRLVGIKTMLPSLADDSEFEQMFRDEARVAKRIQHENVAQLLELGEDGRLFLAMEWVDGETLAALQKAAKPLGGLPLPLLLRITSEALAGLHAAHETKDDSGQPLEVIHRDISPANVLVAMTGEVKILDFGIAKSKGRLHETRASDIIKGKTPYLSPEQLMDGSKIDRRSDLFSFGTMLYVLSTGLHPFRADGDLRTIENIAVKTPPALRDLDPSIHPDLERIVLKALAKSPADRYSTADEMKSEIDALAASVGSPATRAEVAAFLKKCLGDSHETKFKNILVLLPGASAPPSSEVPTDDLTVDLGDEAKPEAAAARAAPVFAGAAADIFGTPKAEPLIADATTQVIEPASSPPLPAEPASQALEPKTESGSEVSDEPAARPPLLVSSIPPPMPKRRPALLIAVGSVLGLCLLIGGIAAIRGSGSAPTTGAETNPTTTAVVAPPPPPVTATAAETVAPAATPVETAAPPTTATATADAVAVQTPPDPPPPPTPPSKGGSRPTGGPAKPPAKGGDRLGLGGSTPPTKPTKPAKPAKPPAHFNPTTL